MTRTALPVDILKWLRIANRSNVLTTAEKTIAVEIGTRINSGTGICFPNLQTIADSVGLALSVAKRAVRKLIQIGLLAVRYTGRSNIYSLRGVPTDPSDRPAQTPRRTKSTNETPPLPPEGQESIEIEATQATDPTPAPPTAHAADPTPADDTPQPENGAEAQPDAPDDITTLIAYFWTISGTKADSARHRKALSKALKTNTRDEIERAAKAAKASWSNPSWITPAAICKPGRVDELLSQAKATAAPRQAAHKPFEPEAPIQRAAPATVAQHLAGLKAALAGRATPS